MYLLICKLIANLRKGQHGFYAIIEFGIDDNTSPPEVTTLCRFINQFITILLLLLY